MKLKLMNACEQRLFDLYEAASLSDKWTTASQIAEFAHTLYPHDPDWISWYASALLETGRVSKAEELLRTLLTADRPSRGWVEIRLGRICQETGRMTEAEAWFRQAVDVNPHTTVAPIYVAQFLARVECFSEARAVLEGALNAEGDIDELYLTMGLVQRSLSDLDGARECFKRALLITPDYPSARRALDDVEEAMRVRTELVGRRNGHG